MDTEAVMRNNVDEALIEQLVRRFYQDVRSDLELGPIFAEAVAGDWEPHLRTMCAFWSSVMLTSGRYKGNPVLAHRRQTRIRPEHFDRWLALFAVAASEICRPDTAAAFVAKAANIAESLRLAMYFTLPEKVDRIS